MHYLPLYSPLLIHASLQGLWHIRSPCPIYAEHPKPSLMRDYSTTPVGSTKVNSRCSEASVTSTTSQHSLPQRTRWWSSWRTWMNIYRDVMLWYTTILQPSIWHTLPWACPTPCRITPLQQLFPFKCNYAFYSCTRDPACSTTAAYNRGCYLAYFGLLWLQLAPSMHQGTALLKAMQAHQILIQIAVLVGFTLYRLH